MTYTFINSKQFQRQIKILSTNAIDKNTAIVLDNKDEEDKQK
jgi:hypothetical protein